MNRYLITMQCKHYKKIATHIKETYPHWAFLFGTSTEGSTYVEWWIGVCFVCAVCTDWTAEQIAHDLDKQFSKDERLEVSYFILREDEVTDSFGQLRSSAWRWFQQTNGHMQFSRLAAPTLVQKVNYGQFDDEIKKELTVRNIDRILEGCKEESPYALENARNAMIERMRVMQVDLVANLMRSAFSGPTF